MDKMTDANELLMGARVQVIVQMIERKDQRIATLVAEAKTNKGWRDEVVQAKRHIVDLEAANEKLEARVVTVQEEQAEHMVAFRTLKTEVKRLTSQLRAVVKWAGEECHDLQDLLDILTEDAGEDSPKEPSLKSVQKAIDDGLDAECLMGNPPSEWLRALAKRAMDKALGTGFADLNNPARGERWRFMARTLEAWATEQHESFTATRTLDAGEDSP